MATLIIETTPTDAQVFVDDEFVWQTAQGPVAIRDLVSLDYEVMVTKDGFRSWDRTIELRSGERRTLSAM
jgi:PEGA domain-containing protein